MIDRSQLSQFFASQKRQKLDEFSQHLPTNSLDAIANALPEFFAERSQRSLLTQVYAMKADLAWAFYELGVTYEAIGDVHRCVESFEQVDQLLNEVEAIRLIEQAFSRS